jgi:hypothetical protein
MHNAVQNAYMAVLFVGFGAKNLSGGSLGHNRALV